jgi:hypothetical protein
MTKFHDELVAARRRGATGSLPVMPQATAEELDLEREAETVEVTYSRMTDGTTFCMICGAVVAPHMTHVHSDDHRRRGY